MYFCETELLEILLFICVNIHLVLNNRQWLRCRKTKPSQTKLVWNAQKKKIYSQTIIEHASKLRDVQIHFPSSQVHASIFHGVIQPESVFGVFVVDPFLNSFVQAAVVQSPVEILHSAAEGLLSSTFFDSKYWRPFQLSRTTTTSNHVISIGQKGQCNPLLSVD